MIVIGCPICGAPWQTCGDDHMTIPPVDFPPPTTREHLMASQHNNPTESQRRAQQQQEQEKREQEKREQESRQQEQNPQQQPGQTGVQEGQGVEQQ